MKKKVAGLFWRMTAFAAFVFCTASCSSYLENLQNACDNCNYTVKYYEQDISDNGYTLIDTNTKTGKAGDDAVYDTKTYTGFYLDTAKTGTGTKIAYGGGSVVNVYYDRDEVTLTFDLAGGTTATTFTTATGTGGTLTGRYGAAVTMAGPVKTGYMFTGWSPTLLGTFPTKDASYTAKWTTENTAAITFVSGNMNVSMDGTTCTAVPRETGDWLYCWYFNGTKLSSTGSVCTISTEDLAPGYYELTVTTEMHGVTWLATCRVTVE